MSGSATRRGLKRPFTASLWCASASLALVVLGCGPASEEVGSEATRDVSEGASPRKHVVMIMLDTLRADHLSLYGYERETSPTLDALAQDSIVFERMLATSSSTAPSQMSILTGTLPRAHGIYNDIPGRPAADFPYLPSLLAEQGYRTAAFADGGILSDAYGFDAGFEHFDSKYESFRHKLDRVESWLDEAPDEPTFLFVHTYGIHAPYLPEPGHDLFSDPSFKGPLAAILRQLSKTRDSGRDIQLEGVLRKFWGLVDHNALSDEEVAYLNAMYDGCIHGIDAGVDRLLIALREKGWLDDAYLVVTSDHGEAFGEHGTFSHRQLYQEELHVPLMIRPPGGTTPLRVPRRTTHLDTAPTLLELLGLPVPEEMQGRSMLPFEGSQEPSDAFATDSGRNMDVVLRGDLKLTERRSGVVLLHDLASDPGELNDLHTTRPEIAKQWRALLDGMRRAAGSLQNRLGTPTVSTDDMDEERLAELRALGYIK